MPGILSSLPDLSATAQLSASAANGVLSVNANLSGMSSAQAGSPLASLAQVMGELRGKLDIDVSGLSKGLPQAITTVQNALPPSSLDFVRGIEGAYTGAQNFLQNSALVKLVGNSPSLKDAALAAIADLLQAFESRQAELTGNLVDPAILQSVNDAFTAISQFGGDFAAHQADFLPFLAKNLLGVGHDILSASLAHAGSALSITTRFDPSAVEAAVGALRTAAENAFVALGDTLDTFDPADGGSYVQIQAELQVALAATQALRDALLPFYQGLTAAVDAHAWDSLFSTLETLLRAVTIDPPFSSNDVINALSDFFNELLMRIQTVADPSELAARIQALNQSIRAAVAGSILGEIRKTIQGFLDRIRQAIEAVPTEQIQRTVEDMLGRVKQEIDSLNLTQIGTTIEQNLQNAETFITDHINDALKNTVKSAIDGLLQNVKQLPVPQIGAQLTDAINQLKNLIQQLENAVQGSLDQLNGFLSQLDCLSFKPVSDEVIAEINDVKSRLQAINPNALSDIEKLALKGALAVLQGIDLEGKVNAQLKVSFHGAGGSLKGLLNDLGAVLDRLKQQLDQFQPQQVVGVLSDALDKASKAADQINAKLLLAPIYGEIDDLAAQLDRLSPGAILDPLEAPYQAVVSTINQLDPARLTAPLNDLYAQIDKLIGFVDVTPLLDDLDQRQRDLLAGARTGILNAFDSLHLPEPLGDLLATLRPILEAMTDALFSSPDEQLKAISIDLPKRVKVSSLFDPLDKVFDNLMAMIRSVPPDALTTTMNTIRESLGVGLEVVNPRNIINAFRTAQGLATEMSPSILLGMPLTLPSLKIGFQASVEGAPADQQGAIATTLVRFDAAIQVVDTSDPQSTVNQLITAQQGLVNSLRRRINALNASGAEAAYGKLRDSLDRILPDFLRQPQPLTYTDILAGIESMRPSRQASRLEDVAATFLQKVAAMEKTVEPAINDFFKAIRETVDLLNPLSVKDSVAAIYDTIRQKVRILDPAALANALKTSIFDPLTASVTQFDPALWKQRLDAAFQRVLGALTGNVKAIIDDIAAVIDEQLRAIREQIKALVTQIKQVFDAAFQGLQEVLDRVEHLVFVEILDRLRKLIDNLEGSFDVELDRVRAAFDDMLAAIPLGGAASASASVSVG
jgi:hypothetical protein